MKRVLFAAIAAAIAAVAQAAALRGVIEGFDGRPWGTEGRLSMLKFMGENSMNAFIYAPRRDVYRNGKWREPYPAADMAEFAVLLAAAKERGIEFYWTVDVGDVSDSLRKEDFAALAKKLQAMYDGGFRAFALCFGGEGHKNPSVHAWLCNRVQREFLAKRKDCAPLAMLPYACTGAGKGEGREYRVSIGKKLDGAIRIFWMGKSRYGEIKQRDVDLAAKEFRREPIVWWNWPANDCCRSRLLLGPAEGMLAAGIAGFAVNAMENCEASKIGVGCAAAWMRDPEGYDAQPAWEKTIDALFADRETAAAMKVFARHNADPGLGAFAFRRPESVAAEALCNAAREELQGGELAKDTAAKLRKLFEETRAAAKLLLAKLPKSRFTLGWEIEGWLDNERLTMEAGLKGLALLGAKGRDADRLAKEIRAVKAEIAQSGERHRAKFAAADGDGDADAVQAPVASGRVLAPMVECILANGLETLYETKTGRRPTGKNGAAATIDELLDALKPL